MSACVEKACIWPATKNGYCTHHSRMFAEIAGRYAGVNTNGNSTASVRLHRLRQSMDGVGTDKRTAHVLMGKMVWLTEDKEPFDTSGMSLLGALEYIQETDEVKCHECGIFFRSLSNHVAAHGITTREYKIKHGFSQHSALRGLFVEIHCFPQGPRAACYVEARKRGLRTINHRAVGRMAVRSVERKNIQSKCRVQLIDRIKKLSDGIGCTPTYDELKSAGIGQTALEYAFGSVRNAMIAAGLSPNPHSPQRSPMQALSATSFMLKQALTHGRGITTAH